MAEYLVRNQKLRIRVPPAPPTIMTQKIAQRIDKDGKISWPYQCVFEWPDVVLYCSEEITPPFFEAMTSPPVHQSGKTLADAEKNAWDKHQANEKVKNK